MKSPKAMLDVCLKRSLILTLCASLFTGSFAYGNEGDILPEFTRQEFKASLQAAESTPYSFRTVGQKIYNHPVAKGGQALATKAAVAGSIAFGVLVAKEFVQRRADAKLGITPETVNTKYQEIEQTWADTQKALYTASDAATLLGPTKGLEYLVGKYLPNLTERQFAGQVLPAFIVGLMFSVGMNLLNEIILLSCRYLIEHDKDQPTSANQDVLGNYLTGGPLTNEELKAITLLVNRVGPTYFNMGYAFGKPDTKKAYRKVFDTLTYIILHEDHLRSIIWSHVWRESAFNGSTLTTFTVVTAVGALRPKIIADAVKFAALKKSGFAALGVVAATLIPDRVNDELTYWEHQLLSAGPMTALNGAQFIDNKEKLLRTFERAQEARQELANKNLTIPKKSVEKIEELMLRQRKMYAVFKSTIDDDLKSNLTKEMTSGASKITYYQKMIGRSMGVILDGYHQDLDKLRDLHYANSEMREILVAEIARVKHAMTALQYYRDALATQYSVTDPNYELDAETYSMVKRLVTQQSYWGFFENGT